MLWDTLQNIWKMMSLRKQNFNREVSIHMARIYNQMEMVIFCFGITVGKTFFIRIPYNIVEHGSTLMFFWILHTPLLIISANCFAEMAALVPAVGAHYHYCYSTMCEFVAFLVGWNLLFAYTAITMSKCSTLSHFIDQHLLNGWVETNLRFMECRGISFIKIHGYVDVISPILIISMACQATRAVKKSKVIFNVLSGITASVMLILIITFGLNMNFITNYVEHKDENVVLYDVFATVQTALIGYESLGVLGEEAKNPTKTIPRSITFAVKYILVFYGLLTVTMSFAVTEKHLIGISTSNPIGGILKNMELTSMSWISYVGTLSALWCSTYGSMFILIRMMYAMSRDGMIFKLFSKVDRHTHTLALPTTIFGLLVGVTATFVAIEYRVSFLSLLFAKIMTSVCLLITRYRLEEQEVNDNAKYDQDRWVLINSPRRQIEPTNVTHRICMLLIHNTVFSVLASVYCIIIIYSSKKEDTKNKFEPLGYISLIACLIFIALLAQQPTNNRTRLSYHIGGVPALPIITIASDFTAVAIICRKFWLWGFVWSGLGVVFYFSYSIFHSEERKSLFQNGTRWNPLKTPNTDNIQDSNLNQMEMDDEREYMKSTITDEPQPDEFAVTSYQ